MDGSMFVGILIFVMLTAIAWARGWKGWALLPVSINLLVGIIVGTLMGDMLLSEETIALVFTAFAICGILGWFCLLAMIIKGR